MIPVEYASNHSWAGKIHSIAANAVKLGNSMKRAESSSVYLMPVHPMSSVKPKSASQVPSPKIAAEAPVVLKYKKVHKENKSPVIRIKTEKFEWKDDTKYNVVKMYTPEKANTGTVEKFEWKDDKMGHVVKMDTPEKANTGTAEKFAWKDGTKYNLVKMGTPEKAKTSTADSKISIDKPKIKHEDQVSSPEVIVDAPEEEPIIAAAPQTAPLNLVKQEQSQFYLTAIL